MDSPPSDFRNELAGKQCKLEVFEIRKDEDLKAISDKSELMGKKIAKASAVFIIAAYDKSASEHIVKTVDAILEPIYRHLDNDIEVGFGDSGWPGCLELDCLVGVTAVYGIEGTNER